MRVRHFSCTCPDKMALVKCPCAFRRVQHFSCRFPQNGSCGDWGPAFLHTSTHKGFCDMSMCCALICHMCALMCHMCAFICVLLLCSYMCDCDFICLLSFMCSSCALIHMLPLCSHMCMYIYIYISVCVCSSMCVLIYVLSCVCALLFALICVLSYVLPYVCSHDAVSLSEFRPRHCLGSLAGIIPVVLHCCKNRKDIGELGCCESRMAKRLH